MFEDAGEADFLDVEMILNVKCTSEDTMEVTSNDLQLDANHPDVRPVGEPDTHAADTCCWCISMMLPGAGLWKAFTWIICIPEKVPCLL